MINGATMELTMLDRLSAALKKADLLTDWERGFVESLQEQFNKRGRLSHRQIEILERIENDKLSSSAVENAKRWFSEYGDEHRRIARICAEYYKVAGYFTSIVHGILDNAESFIPSEKQWKKMCENKYAKKVIAEHDAAPKYPTGSVVAFRSTADWSHRQKSGGMPCVVISSGGTIKSAAKGSKPYKVLPYGSTQIIECEERHIKKCKNPKKVKKVVDTDVPF